MLTQRYADAMQLAWRLHDGQYRKGTKIPYVSHLIAVSSLALARIFRQLGVGSLVAEPVVIGI